MRDRSRAMGRRLRAIDAHDPPPHRARPSARCCELTGETGELLERSITEARRLAARRAQARAWPRRAGEAERGRRRWRSSPTAARRSPRRSTSASRANRSPTGSSRSADPDARPIRKGKLGKPTEFGYVDPARRGDREHPARRARVDPAADHRSSATRPRTRCCPTPSPSSNGSASRPREVALDGGFHAGPTQRRARGLEPERMFISGRQRARLQTHPAAAYSATAPAPRAGSATSNAATACDRTRLKGHDGPADLDRLGDPRLQPRHIHPPHLLPNQAITPTWKPQPSRDREEPNRNGRHQRPVAMLSAQRPGRLSGGSN